MKYIFISIILLMSLGQLNAQFRFDVFGGISPQTTPASADLFVNRHLPHEEFRFNMRKVDPQIFAGIKGHVELGTPFFAEAGLMYSRRKSTYQALYTIIDREHPVSSYIMTETEDMIMLPVNIGVNLGIVDLTSGFRVAQTVGKKTDLDQLAGFMSDDNTLRLGYQASVGVSIFRSRIGIAYLGNFSRVGSGMSVNNQSLELMNVPGQFVLTLQHSL